ncbi:hypothetical protein RhiJN_19934 [Ceratobasidium sp. AG-Ba]|nr:hypothetical protein RhiJN_19934 [Ceratobasidium sp. AG-Ba]
MFTVSLDGKSVESNDTAFQTVSSNYSGTTTQYQQQLWSKSGLDGGDHSITIGNWGLGDRTVGLDYLGITPWEGTDVTPKLLGPGASEVPAGAILVDNENAELTYTRNLCDLIPYGPGSRYFNDTEFCCYTLSATISFQFNGTAFWYFGDGTARVNMTIDGKNEKTVDGIRAGPTQVLLGNATGLTPNLHTVTLTHADLQGGPACLDFFMYLPSPEDEPNPLPSTSPPSEPTKSVPVGAIAGGVVGGIILIVLSLAVVCVLRRKRRLLQARNDTNDTTYAGPAYTDKELEQTSNFNHPVPVNISNQLEYDRYHNTGDGTRGSPYTRTDGTYNALPEPH